MFVSESSLFPLFQLCVSTQIHKVAEYGSNLDTVPIRAHACSLILLILSNTCCNISPFCISFLKLLPVLFIQYLLLIIHASSLLFLFYSCLFNVHHLSNIMVQVPGARDLAPGAPTGARRRTLR